MITANLVRLIAQSMLFVEIILFIIFVVQLEKGIANYIEQEKNEYGYSDEHF